MRICDHCGASFEVDEADGRSRRRRFCTHYCRKRANQLANQGACVDCGGAVSVGRTRCLNCYVRLNEQARLVRWQAVEELWAKGLPGEEIARRVGYSSYASLNAELARMRRHGCNLPYRKTPGSAAAVLRSIAPKSNEDARRLFIAAVRDGLIARPSSCETCGREGHVDGHHQDYTKPFEVRWLCRDCHAAEHRPSVNPQSRRDYTLASGRSA